MKIVLLHHRLAGYTSHHFNESAGLIDEFAKRGRALELLIHARAEPRIVKALKAKPLFDDPTFRLEWSFEERSARFRAMLHKHVAPRVGAGDWVVVTIATQLESHALLEWLEELPERKKPNLFLFFISDRWNRAGPEEYERQAAELAKLRSVIARSTSPDKFVFASLTDLLCEELSKLLGTKVIFAPMPQTYGPPRVVPRNAIPRVAVLGGTRREKGSYLIPEIIRATREQVRVEFLVHLTNNSLTAEESAALRVIRNEPEVTVIEDALPLAEYENAIWSADLALFPYEQIPYFKRTSGVFGEAVAYGKPVVVSPGTWMARQIEAGDAAGVIADSFEPAAFASAIATCVADLEPLTKRAASVSEAWRRTVSMPAFVDVLEGEIAKRPPPPHRRRWWPFS